MASYMEMSFPAGGLNQTPFPAATDLQCHYTTGHAPSHWSFQNGYTQMQQSRKRSSGQAFSFTQPGNAVKRSRPEDMPFGHGIQQSCNPQPSAPSPFLSGISSASEQTCGFPSSYLEHQNVVRAEKNYQTSLLEALLYEVHGC